MNSPIKRKVDQELGKNEMEPSTKSLKEGDADTVTQSSPFTGFVLDEILGENSQTKVMFVKGHFKGKEEEGAIVITLEKTPFNKETVEDVLSERSKANVTLSNDIYGTLELFPPSESSSIKTSTIFPATEKHISKYRDQEVFFLHETSDDYKNITLPYLEKETFSIQWVYNILDKKTEADRIVYEDEDPHTGFILLPDMKWNRKQVEDLYLVAIVKKHGIRSIRELTPEHLPLLKNIYEKGCSSIFEKFGVPMAKLRVYLHYQPSYYHLHVHFTHLKFQAPGSGIERAHLLSDVIENIELDGSFYQKKTLSFASRKGDKLYQLFERSERV